MRCQYIYTSVDVLDFNVKFSSGPAFGIVSQRVHDVSDMAAVRGLNVVHSDSGLIGAYVVADSNNINACVKTAVAGLKELADKGRCHDYVRYLRVTGYQVQVPMLKRLGSRRRPPKCTYAAMHSTPLSSPWTRPLN